MGNFLFADRCVIFPRQIYYPPKDEKNELEKCWAQPYPQNRKEPFICVWPGKNRIGMIVGMDINKGISSKYEMVGLDGMNILHQYHSWLVQIRLVVLGLLMKFPKYGWILRLFNSNRNKISIWLNKRKAFNYPINL